MTTSSRRHEIDRIIAIARDLEPVERAAFLDEACRGDEQLRKEVDSLLAPGRPEYLDAGPPAERSHSPAGAQRRSAAKRNHRPLSNYSIARRWGNGSRLPGLDEQLNRPVALKFLSNYDATEEERMRRFRQEALAASALNHPNILTIYEIGEFEGTNFITAEFVDGETLRARMKADVLPLDLALDIAIQIASALAAAHAAGIIHRDIKPENVMVRADGLVKVLDFGIAKFTQAEDNEKNDLVETIPGAIIGTAAYMSPEQARGAVLDTRSDIWSLGVVIYEMVARRLPFWGNTPADVIAAVIERQPPPCPLTVQLRLDRSNGSSSKHWKRTARTDIKLRRNSGRSEAAKTDTRASCRTRAIRLQSRLLQAGIVGPSNETKTVRRDARRDIWRWRSNHFKRRVFCWATQTSQVCRSGHPGCPYLPPQSAFMSIVRKSIKKQSSQSP